MREKRIDRVVEDPVGMGGVILEICLVPGQESVHAFGARRVITDVFMEEVTEEIVEENDEPDVEMLSLKSDEEDPEDDQDEAEEKRRAEAAHSQNNHQYEQQDFQIGFKATDALRELVLSSVARIANMEETIKYFKCIIPKAVAKPVNYIPSTVSTSH
jgi:hypothetical protein